MLIMDQVWVLAVNKGLHLQCGIDLNRSSLHFASSMALCLNFSIQSPQSHSAISADNILSYSSSALLKLRSNPS